MSKTELTRTGIGWVLSVAGVVSIESPLAHDQDRTYADRHRLGLVRSGRSFHREFTRTCPRQNLRGQAIQELELIMARLTFKKLGN